MPNRADELLQRLNRYGAQGDTLAVILRYLLQQEGKRAETSDGSIDWFTDKPVTSDEAEARYLEQQSNHTRRQANAFFELTPAALPTDARAPLSNGPAQERNAEPARLSQGASRPWSVGYGYSGSAAAAIARAPAGMRYDQALNFFREDSGRPVSVSIEHYAHECATAYMREPSTYGAPPTVTMPQGWRLEMSTDGGAYVAVPDQADLDIELAEANAQEPDHD